MNTHHKTRGHIGHERAGGPDIAMAQLLELDAEVLAPYLAELTGWIADLTHPAPARILDLGSGPGTGSLALAHRFGSAQVTAVDISPQMLHRLHKQAAAHSVTRRISTLEANLDEPWAEIGEGGPYDLIWAAALLHHVADPARTLAQAFEHVRPGGLLAVTEMDFFPRFLPEDIGIGSPGLEARLHAATNTQPPHEWTGELTDAGFTLEERRPFDIRLDRAQAGPALNDYAQICLAKLRSHATEALDADDLDALDALLDETQPHSIARRADLTVRTTRTTWIARRP
ncbi:class I SAM-dependent methyltransferase [Streptomyces sp. CJ_13]|uniref:class I SAM-dependent methyltransferase n=1 Tax=Streptomyces TaxID=1883 RepID=UPI001BDC36D8|nr:class I SAM-dependent methyltransferase [Streptomyces sp. CJ_13]MBT1184018.1 class I SAM-dependent methyltransferase [Streptomyces sp. CJ_13]